MVISNHVHEYLHKIKCWMMGRSEPDESFTDLVFPLPPSPLCEALKKDGHFGVECAGNYTDLNTISVILIFKQS